MNLPGFDEKWKLDRAALAHILSWKGTLQGCTKEYPGLNFCHSSGENTWGRGWMTKASGGRRKKEGKRWVAEGLSSSCRGIVRPNEDATMIYDKWYMIYNNDIYGEGGRGGPYAWKITWCPWGAPEYLLKQEDSSELTLAFVIMPLIANNDKL